MKTVLCYGDSLTWGYNADGSGRLAFEDRWPSVLQAGLGNDALVIAEGLNGRTTIFDDWAAGADRNGARTLPTILSAHSPIDLIIIMLGTNDLKPVLCGRAHGSRQGMERLIDIVRGHDYPFDAAPPQILIMAPPELCETTNADFAGVYEGALAESAKLASLYRQVGEKMGCAFFDAGKVARTHPADGVHLDRENTRAIGQGLVPEVRSLLGL
jgi:lysophospholipase L1-like esterase